VSTECDFLACFSIEFESEFLYDNYGDKPKKKNMGMQNTRNLVSTTRKDSELIVKNMHGLSPAEALEDMHVQICVLRMLTCL